jgi:hypothetical protein
VLGPIFLSDESAMSRNLARMAAAWRLGRGMEKEQMEKEQP